MLGVSEDGAGNVGVKRLRALPLYHFQGVAMATVDRSEGRTSSTEDTTGSSRHADFSFLWRNALPWASLQYFFMGLPVRGRPHH